MDKARKARKRFWDCRPVGNSTFYPVMSAKKSLKKKRAAIPIHRCSTSSTKDTRVPSKLSFSSAYHPQLPRHPLTSDALPASPALTPE